MMIDDKTVLVKGWIREEGFEGEVDIDARLWTDLNWVSRMDVLKDWISGLQQVYNSMLSSANAGLEDEIRAQKDSAPEWVDISRRL